MAMATATATATMRTMAMATHIDLQGLRLVNVLQFHQILTDEACDIGTDVRCECQSPIRVYRWPRRVPPEGYRVQILTGALARA